MSKTKQKDIDYVKKVIDKISFDQDSHSSFFETINNLQSFTGINGAKALYSVLSTVISLKDAAMIAYQGNVADYLIEKGNLFEHLSKEPNNEKIANLVSSFISNISNSYSNLHPDFIEEIRDATTEVRNYQNSIFDLEERNRRLEALDKNGNKNEIEENLIKIKEIKKREPEIQKIQNQLISDYKSIIKIAMFDFYPLAKELDNRTFFKAIFAQPKYQFKLVQDENAKINDDEIAIFRNDSGQVFLKSKFGKKNIELKIDKADEVGVSPEFYAAIQSGNLKEISPKDQKSLANFISVNAFPGVTQKAFENLMSYISLAATFGPERSAKQVEMVNGFIELATQEHVKKELLPMLNQKLLDRVLELPNIPPTVKDYVPLIHDLSGNKDKFKNLASALINRDPEFRNFVSDIMEYVNVPYYDENKPESKEYKQAIDSFNKSMDSLIDMTVNADTLAAAIPLIDDKFIDNIFKLPNVDKALNSKEFLIKSKENLDNLQKDCSTLTAKVGMKEAFGAATSNEEDIGDIYNKITTMLDILEQEKNKNSKSNEPSPILAKLVGSIKTMAKDKESCKKLADTFTESKESMTKALDKVIDHPAAGAALRGFCLSGQEVAEFLPKVMTEKGLTAVAKYVEKPNTWRLVNIFVQTNTLGFAISHYVQSLSPWRATDKVQSNSDIKEIDKNLQKYFGDKLSFVEKEERRRGESITNEKSV